ncbi:MAG TPA: type II toxin-antitoxin system VapC family toxin [Solirubrobacteraceae bacterium]|jgi:PIN domain nuclease of toxin-antitoxin system|nr:type II toxin-antitoxin system VapC family toxin [Solirubrobacteraceae bacterium]
MGDPEVLRGRGRLRLLLDTHTLVWASDKRLGEEAREAIEAPANTIFVSAATIWEIEIKRALDKLRTVEDAVQLVDKSGFERLTIDYEHAREAGRLPLLHGDPFDRMLIAQARVEGLTLATADATIKRYDVPVFDVASV